jgi:hypothetical protein
VGLREKMNDNPQITTGVTAAIILLVVGYIIYASMGGSAGVRVPAGSVKVFFTDDDGATWFPDDSKKVPPFDHNGKQAYGAVVYKCAGKTFVNHMFRYTPEAKKKVEEIYAKNLPQDDPTVMETIDGAGKELKSPGQKDWVKLTEMNKARAIMQPKCPGGDLEMVTP